MYFKTEVCNHTQFTNFSTKTHGLGQSKEAFQMFKLMNKQYSQFFTQNYGRMHKFQKFRGLDFINIIQCIIDWISPP